VGADGTMFPAVKEHPDLPAEGQALPGPQHGHRRAQPPHQEVQVCDCECQAPCAGLKKLNVHIKTISNFFLALIVFDLFCF